MCAAFFGEQDPRNFACKLPPSFASDTVPKAELYAAIRGAQLALPGATIWTDSSYVALAADIRMSASWKANMDYINSLRRICKEKGLVIEKVRAHSGVPGNEAADALCTALLNQLDGAEPPS